MNRYSFIGKGDVLLRAGTDALYGSRQCKQGEPIGYFSDVFVSLDFSIIEKIAKSGTSNLLGSSDYKPSAFVISGIKTSDTFLDLVYKAKKGESKLRTIIKKLNSSGGVLYLPLNLNDELLNDIFVYTSTTKERVQDFTVDYSNNTINGLVDGQYTIFYKIKREANMTYSLISNNIPVMSIEVNVRGNINGKDGELVLHLNKTKLLVNPNLNLNNDNPFVDSLEFGVLDENKEIVEVSYYEK